MRKLYLVVFFSLVIMFPAIAQEATISGKITDKNTKEEIPGVNIILNETTGVVSDVYGNYTIKVPVGKVKLTYRFIGYTNEVRTVNLQQGEMITLNIKMEETQTVLDEVVVSAGKFEQKLSDVTVSMDIVPAKIIENNNTINIATAVNKVPGVTMLDDQASIRGGSGYSFGAGSRVMLTVDEMPLMEGASGEAKWWFVPTENIEQMEVIKGASSALFGSSALNGVVNFRTAYPRSKPKTKLILSSGFYMNPERKHIDPFDSKNPAFSNIQFLHSRKMGQFDLILGGNVLTDQSYREFNATEWFRINGNLRWRSKKVDGLSIGVNANIMKRRNESFVLWADGDTGVYSVSPDFMLVNRNHYFIIDPYFIFFKNKRTRYSLRTRYYKVDNYNDNDQNNGNDLVFFDYSYMKHFEKKLTMTLGFTGSYTESKAQIYGDEYHRSINGGMYGQFDKKFKKTTVSIGARWEGFKLDEDELDHMPVFRSGINRQLAEMGFLRASFGMGYRYPTIAERYTKTSAGSLNIFPNDTLQAEKGWSAEIGYKQGFRISDWNGYVDLAAFWTEYHNMIEFTFGQHNPDSIPLTAFNFSEWTGFRAYNIGNARITGLDFTVTGRGKILNLPVSILAGYTYTNPIDLNSDRDSLKTTDESILKYRFYHMAKLDIEVQWEELSIGLGMEYTSHMINIDKAFEDTLRFPNGAPIIQNGEPIMILPGVYEYRQKNNKGNLVFDLRVAYQLNENVRISIIAKNLFNEEYMTRPGNVMPPRSLAFQFSYRL